MKKKSKFLVFILSLLPGLSHLYLGWTRRALVFFSVFLGLFVGAVTMGNINYQTSNMLGPLIFFVIALLWFVALAEAMNLANRNIEPGVNNEDSILNAEEKGLLFISDRKLIALAFSSIPGAGHMYLGLIKQGAQLMAGFFFMLLLSGWLNLSLLEFVIPVIWFYSVFDIYHLLEDEEEVQLESSTIFDWFSTHPGWLGWGLITLGLLVIVQRIASPALAHLFSDTMRSYIETTFVALILIGGGIKLLLGNKVEDQKKEAASLPAKQVDNEKINEEAAPEKNHEETEEEIQ
ncbi:MAG: hypothetical protein PHC92_11355 [Syntrophomonadaceae bacterium]|nr:hypothetical protein [Syntrophomonadaceae bacterium]MDD3023097.1 hypothetical protein [Syntrophomonadaceae bacterium]